MKPTGFAVPTLEEVAAHAGVSRATVSRVVNGATTVNPAISVRVQSSIEELGYVPNRAARSLASAQSHAIALVVPEDVTRVFGDVYFAAIVAGLSERLERSEYVLSLMAATQRPSAKTLRFLAGGAVDGAVVVSHHGLDSFLNQLVNTLPVVFGGRTGVEGNDVYIVDVDNIAAARKGTQHLITIGRKRIATITGPADMVSARDRVDGWREAIESAGLVPGPQADGDFTANGGMRAMIELLDGGEPFDSVFIGSDLMASGAMLELAKRGLRVPEDIAVVGFDDSVVALTTSPPLTTVRQPAREMGYQMGETLIAVLEGRNDVPHQVELPTELIIRGSA